MTTTPATLFDKPEAFMDLFNRMEAVLRRLDNDFPELHGDEDLSGADAVDRITEIRIQAKHVLASLPTVDGPGTVS
ncbi:hypothetical protein [Hyphomicrobium sp. DY-1]|uniref:hypothetical protein n=1 Tax=Hyphomicrobium sp. DY-1 TaxID=3075650 RepID=UPI0039C12C60